jgi:hypothetical protein
MLLMAEVFENGTDGYENIRTSSGVILKDFKLRTSHNNARD